MHVDTYRSEGGLLPPDLLDRVLAGEWGGQQDRDFGPEVGRLAQAIPAAWGEIRTHWASFRLALRRLGPEESATGLTREWMTRCLRVLGYRLVYQERAAVVDGQRYDLSHRVAEADGMPVHIVAVGRDLTRRLPGVERLSPFALVQEYLNRTEHLWGLVTNGEQLWLCRAHPGGGRPRLVAWDLATMLDSEKYEDFVIFYRLCHASRLPRRAEDGPGCWWERWVAQVQIEGGRVRDRLRDGVVAAIERLGEGFLAHPANAALRAAVRAGTVGPAAYYQELLRLIYRLLFLCVAEERRLLIPPGDAATAAIWARCFSVERLRALAGTPPATWPADADDLWEGLKDTFQCLGYHPEGAPLPLPPLNGQLFHPDALPHLEAAALDNRTLLEAVAALSYFTQEGVRRRVAYAALDVEELGSVYESLLDYAPQWALEGGRLGFRLDPGTERKSTGSYYTPPELVQLVLDEALDPLIAERKRQPRGAAALLDLTVLDPACGSGHFLLAAARRIARAVVEVEQGAGEPGPAAFQQALRRVIERCLYGVDCNPLAVELCKVALWIEGHLPGRPLSFLDAHIRCGDSLVGLDDLAALQAGIPDGAYTCKTGDSQDVAARIRRQNAADRTGLLRWEAVLGPEEPAAGLAAWSDRQQALVETPTERVEDVLAKAAAYAALREPGSPWHRVWQAANLWTAAFFAPLTAETATTVPSTRHVWDLLQGRAVPAAVAAQAEAQAAAVRAFHWPLEFPEIWRRGGFDLVIGNPPWERVKLQEVEWFATRDPAIARAPHQAERRRRIAALATEQPALWAAFQAAKHAAEAAAGFIRTSGRFPRVAGDLNTYVAFVELARAVVHPAGMVGLVVPTGLVTDYSTRAVFGDILAQQQLVSCYDFENREKLFPAVDSRQKFCVLTLSGRPVERARFGFFWTRVADRHVPQRRFTLTPADLRRVNPNTGTCPVFRTRADAELTAAVYRRVPVLVDRARGANPWGIQFFTMFHMANDSGLFADAPGPERLPLYEAKLIHQFDHRWATYAGEAVREATAAEHADPAWTVTPRYWVDAAAVAARVPEGWRHRWFLGFRGIARATDERTVIASVMPWAGVGHSLPLFWAPGRSSVQLAALLANLNALVFDYVARQKVGGSNLTFFVMEQLPVLPPTAYTPDDLAFVVPRVLELIYTAWDLAPFARDCGYEGPPFPWDPARRAELRAELDAYFACRYGLSREELEYILNPAAVYGPDFPGETFRVLKAHELQTYGEYRTARLVLAAYDRWASTFGARAAAPAG